MARAFLIVVVARLLCVARPAHAQAAPPAAHEDQAFDFMNLLAHHDLHDISNETWNAYGQFTYISSWKLPFPAPYTNANGSIYSLVPQAERSFASVFTLFFGLHLWQGGEFYLSPEFVAERGLSLIRGLGGSIQDYELQKSGSEIPSLYRSRTFLRQTFNLGGNPVEKTSDPLQLASVARDRRIVLTMGSFTVLDVFDRNNVTWDPRQTS
jgi:high affinity Mn2+ porin